MTWQLDDTQPSRPIQKRGNSGWLVTVLLMVIALLVGMLLTSNNVINVGQQTTPTSPPTLTQAPTETFPPSTPLSSLTPSQTLLPPPTFAPPSHTPLPSDTPTVTPSATIFIEANIPGLQGLETDTLTPEEVCEPRDDWTLRYEVQQNDALERIAAQYSTTAYELVEANCLVDANIIVVGQKLRVPGGAHPEQPLYECFPIEVHTPFNGAFTVEGEGTLTFNWRGPNVPRYLIRVIQPDGEIWEHLVERRQNETIDLFEELPQAGVHTWSVYPLGMDFLQINCPEGGPWTFNKALAPTNTPTMTPSPTQAPIGAGP